MDKHSKTIKLFEFDKSLEQVIVGVDEAGRGPLAGPVVCASVIMPLDNYIDGIDDSKKLSSNKRQILFDKIMSVAIAYGISIIPHTTIDTINILEATKRGMCESISAIVKAQFDIVCIDHVGLDIEHRTLSITKGDSTSYSIAAASIIAKTTRDNIMLDYHKQYPLYGFDSHKGYGTSKHIEAIKQHGICAIHRRTFVKKLVYHSVQQ